MNLKNIENKKDLFQDFFLWLFDDNRITNKNVSLIGEIDLSLCPDYSDSAIYYPKQFENFFETPAMKRLSRISQLGLAINNCPNFYHSRLEHSKGTYNKKLEEFFYNYQNPEWKNYIEKNNLKLYLIAELLKMAGHDIGHPPLSHAFEEKIFEYRGAHEDIGKRLMLENPEIQSVYNSISPDLLEIMKDLYNEDFLNFKIHDESNYDVDRLDYLSRDNFYQGNASILDTQKYNITSVAVDEQGNPKLNDDLSICVSDENKNFIDVYDFESLQEIENALLLRENGYKEIYLSPNTHIYETCIESFINAFLEEDSTIGKSLRNILLHMKNHNINQIDLNKYIDFDEVLLYSELLDIAQNHENPNIRDLATMIIPNMYSFMNLMYSHLKLYTDNQQYSENDKSVLRKIKNVISSNSTISNNLRNNNFTYSNTIILPDDFTSEYDIPLVKQRNKINAYKTREPIYIRDNNGRIFELSNHPNKSQNWKNKSSQISLNYAFIPYLRFKGIPEKYIKELSEKYPCASEYCKVKINTNNQKNNLEDKFLDL